MTTTNKPTVVFEQYLTLTSNWLQEIVEPYLQLEQYTAHKTYDKKSTIFLTQYDQPLTTVAQQFRDDGYPIAYDNLSEAVISDTAKHIIQTPNWFRYNESLRYSYHKHNTYRPNRTYKHLALMPMRMRKPHRDLAQQQLQPWLNDFIWSYVDCGRQLPNDGNMLDWATQRHFHPDWYNDTCFSFVSETTVRLNNNVALISEKTYKPIAFYHPFLILGPMTTLKSLRSQGFETFDNLFDESYDTEPSWVKRLNCLVNNVKLYKKQPYDTETQQKLIHNHELFFDTQLVTDCVVKEVVEPLLNYVEK
jgi:hypothetical protein